MNWLKKIYFRLRNPLPKIYLPHDQEIKKTQQRWLFSFIILLAFAAWYTHEYAVFKVNQNKLTPVVVVNKNLEAPHKIVDGDLKMVSRPKKDLPESVLTDLKSVMGKTVTQNMVKNQILLSHQLQEDLDPESVSARFGELFAFSIDESWMSSRFPEIKKNDHIDIVVSNSKQVKSSSAIVAKRVKVISLDTGRDKKRTLVVNITRPEAEGILLAHALQLPMQILVYPGINSEKNNSVNLSDQES